MGKTLYFEGAGMDFYSNEQTDFSDVGNFRIRTVFKNLEGKMYFLEMGRGCRDLNKKGKNRFEWALFASHCFEITGDHDDENKNRVKTDWIHTRDNYTYTKKDITEWLNKNLNCDFDTIEVLDFFYGYRTFDDKHHVYNLMENIELNHERAAKRKAAYENTDIEYREALNEKYSIIGLLEMGPESITIRCHASDSKIGDLPRVKKIQIV